MNLTTVTISDLKPHPNNPNTHPVKQIDALGESLDKFEQVKNIVVWNDIIIAGHGIVAAAIKAGREILEAEDISHLSYEIATEFMLADIRTPGMAIVDEEAMVEALRTIDEPLDIPGFDEDFLKSIRFDENWRDDVDFKEYDESVEDEVKYIECPHCGEKFPE